MKSRLTNAEEADIDESTQQSSPLLWSSSAARFSVNDTRERRSSTNAKDNRRDQFSGSTLRSLWAAASVAPLALGVLTGILLLFMIVLSFARPGSLHRYLGLKPTLLSPGRSDLVSPSIQHAGHDTDNSSNKSTVLPLHPIEYLRVCAKNGYVQHGDYWDTDIQDDMGSDMHNAETNESSMACSKTITYMLDGTVGLTADLALIAQAAALAREVNQCIILLSLYLRLISLSEIVHFWLTIRTGTEESQ